MVAKFCVQNKHELVDVCHGGFGCSFHCINYNLFPGNKSSNCKPGEEFENGMRCRTLTSVRCLLNDQKSTFMFRNYLKIARRSLLKNKAYSTLNILGLATGMGVALIIGLWVYYQYSYDKFLPDYKQVYQVRRNFYGNGDTMTYGGTSLKLADVLRNQVPEIESVAETDGGSMHGLMAGNKKFYLNGNMVASDFLTMFQFPLLQGNAKNVLNNPYSIVLTQSTAKALFGNENPLNKIVRFDDKNDLKVTGVLKDVPSNSTLQFSYLVPFGYLESTDDFTKQARTAGFGW